MPKTRSSSAAGGHLRWGRRPAAHHIAWSIRPRWTSSCPLRLSMRTTRRPAGHRVASPGAVIGVPACTAGRS